MDEKTKQQIKERVMISIIVAAFVLLLTAAVFMFLGQRSLEEQTPEGYNCVDLEGTKMNEKLCFPITTEGNIVQCYQKNILWKCQEIIPMEAP